MNNICFVSVLHRRCRPAGDETASVVIFRQLANLPTPRSGANSPITLNRSPAFLLEWFNLRDKLNLVSSLRPEQPYDGKTSLLSALRLPSRILIFEHDSHLVFDLCRAPRAGLRQLSERVPEPLAPGSERGKAEIPLQ